MNREHRRADGGGGTPVDVWSPRDAATHALTNEGWGFETNCFVCEPRNPRGLGIRFHLDARAAVVVAELALDDAFSGAPQLVHGGVILAVLDEAMAWAALAIGRRLALTAESSAVFRRPVRVGAAYRAEARLVSANEAELRTEAHVLDARDRVCVDAAARFAILSSGQIESAVGARVQSTVAGHIPGAAATPE